ncbi:DUF2808 domain-containing protein [Gloeocapsopsis dulcis]|uniref:DUF2808 domain-containing protein n=1 Tax=Gloeocapsopsis dulcis AAB1 = 1H9 TaxID=1433147 RepID=A0A6N8FW65_9CHRO|nr:DUF2808 domain-containing protein [Gloeocapsopsis dulcis]MUL37370.1 hypothetical protein [Gloeocapsopsis dulcis AAB1 = 1H9]WNN88915.1 DUF2808 domain-containing protein [Gloeocapsopsis dulcis]
MKFLNPSVLLSTTLVLTAISGTTPQVTQAVQLRDGTVYFVQPPDLVAATTTVNGVSAWGATYYFTINIPKNADEPLQRVTITQRGGSDNVRFRLDDSRAFEGTRDRRGTQLTLGEVTRDCTKCSARGDRDTRTVNVTLDPPVAPGRTITIGLRPVRNPLFSGVYLFGVTAFPPGEKAHGQFLGFGRFHFYGNDRPFFMWR